MSKSIPWRGEMDRLRAEMDRLYDRFFDRRPFHRGVEEGDWIPAVDVSETAKEILVEAEIAGMDPKDIDVTLQGGVLSLKGERKQQREDKDQNFHRVERAYGSFLRTIELPAEVDPNKVKAAYRDGLLKIRLAKSRKETGKKIEVKGTV